MRRLFGLFSSVVQLLDFVWFCAFLAGNGFRIIGSSGCLGFSDNLDITIFPLTLAQFDRSVANIFACIMYINRRQDIY